MKHLPALLGALLGVFGFSVSTLGAEASQPLRALYITGGCCHDYNREKIILTQGVTARANVEWTIIQEGGRGTRRENIESSIYQNPGWAEGFDIVVHNECFADDADPDFIEKVLAPHRSGVPAVVVHCTMHTFRALKTDAFREFLGVSSFGHGPAHPLDVKVLQPDHPIMKGFPDGWKTGNEELYAIAKVWPNTVPLAQAADKRKDAAGAWKDTEKTHAVIWVNTCGNARVFGTTLAHANQTFEDAAFLDMFTRGLLWACDKLDPSGQPKPGHGTSK